MAAGTWLAGAIIGKLVMDKTGWTAAAKSISDDLTKMSGLSKTTADSFKRAGTIMIGIGGAIAGAIYGVAKAADESAKVQGQMAAVLKSTGGAAGLAAGELNNLAAGLQKVTTYDDEAILGGQNLLLTFTSIGKDIFPAATTAMLDMSTALGQDLKGSAIQLGKALQDPVLGMTALRKAGVSFTDGQKDMIKRLVESGDKLGAQKIILGELAREFGGSAKAAAETFGGQLSQLRNSVGDLKESMGAAFLPVLKDMVAAIKPIVEKTREWVEAHPELVSMISKAALGVGVLMTALGPFVFMIPKLIGMLKDFKIALAGMNVGFIAVAGGLLAVGAAADKLINKYKAQQDAEMQAIIKQSGPALEAIRMRTSLINAHVITVEQWGEIMQKHGRDYGKVMNAIATDPAYASIRVEWDKIRKAQDEAKGSTKGLGDEYDGLSEKTKKYNEKLAQLLESLGISAEKNRELIDTDRILHDLYGKKLISLEKFNTAHQQLINQMFEYGEIIPTATIRTQELTKNIEFLTTISQSVADQFRIIRTTTLDMNSVLGQAPGQVEDLEYQYQKLNHTLPATIEFNRKLAAQLPALGNAIMQAVYSMKGLKAPQIDWKPLADGAKQATAEMYQPFDQLWSDVASGFGDAVKGMLFEGDSLKEGWKGICDSMKEAVSSMIGEMVTRWVKALLTDMVGAATSAAGSTAATFSGLGATVGGIAATIGTVITTLAAAIATAIGTIAAGIGTALVTVATAVATAATILAAAIVPLLTVGAAALALYVAFQLAKGLLDKLFGGGGGDKSTQMAQDSRNFLAEIRNWMFSAGSGFGGASYEFITGHIGEWLGWINNSVNEKGASIFGATNTMRTEICKRLDSVIKAIGSIPRAQRGAVLSEPGLVMTHGTPGEPEWVIPEQRLFRLAAAPAAGGGRGVNIVNSVSLEGTMITDREYVRSRLIPELLAALNSHEFKGQFQRALGVA